MDMFKLFQSMYFQLLLFLIKYLHGKEITTKSDLHLLPDESSPEPRISYSKGSIKPGMTIGGHDVWPITRPEVAQIRNINVKCEKNHMKVTIEFDRSFYGVIFSKGHFSDSKCVHLPAGSGNTLTKFDIFLGTCGTISSDSDLYGGGGGSGPSRATSGLYIENTIIIQYDSQVQEIWDLARKLRCTWYDYYEKPVSFRPFNVDMMDAVTANFLGDNIQCWMQIQAGKGPWASEVNGIVKIGQTMTMVLAIKDDEGKFDMLVRDCIAHDGQHAPIRFVDDFGCVTRPKIMSQFQKVKNFGSTATVVSYAYFQAFKFPDSMDVYFQCTVQVCRYECPDAKCSKAGETISKVDVQSKSSSSSSSSSSPLLSSNDYPMAHKNSPIYDGLSSDYVTEEGYPDVRSESSTRIVPSTEYTRSELPFNSMVRKQGINEHSLNSSSYNKTNKSYSSASSSSSSKVYKNLAMPRHMKRSTRNVQVNSPNISRKSYNNDDYVKSIDFTDIRTEKIIHVVAPGDVSFYIPSSIDGNVSSSSLSETFSYKFDYNENLVCLARSNFLLFSLTILTLVLITSSSSLCLYYRLRKFLRHRCLSSSSPVISSCESSANLSDSNQFPRIPGFGLFHSRR